MNQKAIEQLGQAIDLLFGRPGAANVALNNLELIKALDEAIKAFNAQAKQAESASSECETHG